MNRDAPAPTGSLRRLLPFSACMVASALAWSGGNAATRKRDPPVEVHLAGNGVFDLETLDPASTSQFRARQALLHSARQLAARTRYPCFRIIHEVWASRVRVIETRSGRTIIDYGSVPGEWRRYWKLYRHQFFSGAPTGASRKRRASYRMGRMTIQLLAMRPPAQDGDIVCDPSLEGDHPTPSSQPHH